MCNMMQYEIHASLYRSVSFVWWKKRQRLISVLAFSLNKFSAKCSHSQSDVNASDTERKAKWQKMSRSCDGSDPARPKCNCKDK